MVQVEDKTVEAPSMPELRMESNGHKQHNLQLLLASLQNGSPNLRGGAAIAFTAASQGNSANNVAQLFAVELARHTCRRTLIISALAGPRR